MFYPFERQWENHYRTLAADTLALYIAKTSWDIMLVSEMVPSSEPYPLTYDRPSHHPHNTDSQINKYRALAKLPEGAQEPFHKWFLSLYL